MADIRKGISLDDEREVSVESVRQFVSTLSELTGKIKDARTDLREALKSSDSVVSLDEQMKDLREEKKKVISENAVLVGYASVLDEAQEEKKQLIDDAKQDGIPHKEITMAIKMLKGDIAPEVVNQIFANISNLVD